MYFAILINPFLRISTFCSQFINGLDISRLLNFNKRLILTVKNIWRLSFLTNKIGLLSMRYSIYVAKLQKKFDIEHFFPENHKKCCPFNNLS